MFGDVAGGHKARALRAVTWLIWAIACGVAVWNTRHPVYLLMMAICVVLVRTVFTGKRGVNDMVLLGGLVLGGAVLNAAWARAGDTRIFMLPAWLPLIGGAITLEALVYGALNGLALFVLLSAFHVFNQAVRVQELIGLVPRAFGPLAMVSAIALAYAPMTQRQARAIRDAQAVRGHTVRGPRDALPLLMPLLAGALERAFALAEAMTARGFAPAHTPRQRRMHRLWQALATLGVFAAAGGLLLRDMAQMQGLAWVSTAGGLLAAFAIWKLGQMQARTRYRMQRLGWPDVIVIAAALAHAAMPPLSPALAVALAYVPYPTLTMPGVSADAFLLSMLPAVPALAGWRGWR